MHRFHDSRFQGVRLVCRLRRSSAATSGVPSGPAAMAAQRASSASPQRSPERAEAEQPEDEKQTEDANVGETMPEQEKGRVAEKYFVVKSLTLQDLELSVRNGIWATQSHNEETLNKAYHSADSVYLIFSANKSGEYFGYARMASPILEDSSEIMRSVPQAGTVAPSDAPKSIPTPATQYAPKGRIIDDSARGTIFWEADHSDSGDDTNPDLQSGSSGMAGLEGPMSWGKPFKVEWMSTHRLPFYRTRGLRNPWNANREVKIARDGTELEPSVGKRLVQMFHRLGPSNAGQAAQPQNVQSAGVPSQMRPF